MTSDARVSEPPAPPISNAADSRVVGSRVVESAVAVALAADDRYVVPLAVTVRSLLDHVDGSAGVRVFVIDGGISRRHKRRLLASWPRERADVRFVPVSASQWGRRQPDLAHASPMTYARLHLPDILPADVSRVVYLDADIIVRADITMLWRDVHGVHPAWAVPDMAVPVFDAEAAWPEDTPNRAVVVRHGLPIPNYRSLGLPADGVYMNAGVMVLDLDAWRREHLTKRCAQVLNDHAASARWADQYALNVLLAGRWGHLDARWNVGTAFFRDAGSPAVPPVAAGTSRLWHDPHIVHFTTSEKPWLPGCRHPWTPTFFEVLDRTSWAGWRPRVRRRFGMRARVERYGRRAARVWRGLTHS